MDQILQVDLASRCFLEYLSLLDLQGFQEDPADQPNLDDPLNLSGHRHLCLPSHHRFQVVLTNFLLDLFTQKYITNQSHQIFHVDQLARQDLEVRFHPSNLVHLSRKIKCCNLSQQAWDKIETKMYESWTIKNCNNKKKEYSAFYVLYAVELQPVSCKQFWSKFWSKSLLMTSLEVKLQRHGEACSTFNIGQTVSGKSFN